MEDYVTDTCPICSDHPVPFRSTASVSGRYQCSSCRGEVSAASEPVVTQIVDVALDKTVRPACARPGQSVRYTITVCNRSSVPVSQVLVTDPDMERKLDVGTIFYNGAAVPGGSLSRGLRIPGLGAGCCAVITFDAAVPPDAAGEIANTACAEFEFTSDACGRVLAAAVSNEAVLHVVSPGLAITKHAVPCALSPEERVVTYTLTVRNTGTCPIEDAVVTDALPAGLTYVRGSTAVNGGAPIDRDPALGVPLGPLAAGQSAAISFRAAAEF